MQDNRDRFVKQLEETIGRPRNVSGVPKEISMAFPSNRFRPFSLIEVDGKSGRRLSAGSLA